MKISLFKQVSIAALAAGSVLPTAAHAMQAEQPSIEPAQEAREGGLDEIVVTARRREESAQDVPISISAFSGDQLEAQSAVKVTDIARLTPNLVVTPGGGSGTGGVVIGIRGQVQTDTIGSLDPSVGIYVDGVYWARSNGANADLVDIDRVEVLKGPQGTLFGRNTTGGALSITTGAPDPTRASGLIQGRIGNFGQHDFAAVLNLPLVTDKVALRLSGNKLNNNGFNRNLTTGNRIGNQDSYTVRAKLLVEPVEALTIIGSYEHYDIGQKARATRLIYAQPFPAAPEIIAALTTGGCLQAFNAACPAPFVPGSQSFGQFAGTGSFYDTYSGLDARETLNTDTASVTATLDLSFATLKYIGAYREMDSDSGRYDYDGTPFVILHPQNYAESKQWSHELQLNGEAFGERLNYTLGGYLFRESGFDGSNTLALPLLNPINPSITSGDVTTRSFALFGQGSFRVTDALSFTGGLRYSKDKKGLDISSTAGGNCALRAGSPPVLLPNTACLVSQRRTDSAVSYLASLEYKFDRDILLYLKTSRGYRAGGFNLRGTTPETYGPFAPEFVTDYEVGLKTEFFDRRLRFNISAFHTNYDDIQRGVLVPNGVGGVATTTINAGKARINGLEAELTARPVDGLLLSGTLGLTDAKYQEFNSACPANYPATAAAPCVNGVFSRAGEDFERVPSVTWSLAGSYTVPAPLGSATIRADYSHQSATQQVGLTQTLTPNLAQFVRQAGYGLLNARISWDIEEPDMSIAAYARNLTKTKYYNYQLDLVNAGLGYMIGNAGLPRQYGIEATFRF